MVAIPATDAGAGPFVTCEEVASARLEAIEERKVAYWALPRAERERKLWVAGIRKQRVRRANVGLSARDAEQMEREAAAAHVRARFHWGRRTDVSKLEFESAMVSAVRRGRCPPWVRSLCSIVAGVALSLRG